MVEMDTSLARRNILIAKRIALVCKEIAKNRRGQKVARDNTKTMRLENSIRHWRSWRSK